EVVSDSPAEKAGIKAKDIIVSFGGESIHGPMRLTERIHAAKPGDKVDVEVVRDGRHQTIAVELGSRPNTFSFWSGDGKKWIQGMPDAESFKDLGNNLKDLEKLKELPGMLQWKMFGSRPKLGIQIVETTPELREHLGATREGGVLVGKVLSGTP